MEHVSIVCVIFEQMWQLKLQQKEELDELTTKCEQLETKYAEKVKECKHVREFIAFVDFVITSCYSSQLYAVRHSLQEKITEAEDGYSDGDKDGSSEDKETCGVHQIKEDLSSI